MSRLPRLPASIAVLVSVVAVLLLWPQARSYLGRGALMATRPLVVSGTWLADQFHLSSSRRSLEKQDQTLRQQVSDLTAQLHETNLMLESSKVVEQLSKFTKQSKRRVVMANVTTSSPDPGIQSIVVDRGSDDGAAVGNAVVTDAGVVVGKVANVRQTISTVLLLSDRQSVVAARLQNSTQSPGVVRGERGLTLRMEFIPRGDAIVPGQTVVTAGTEPSVPPDLLIGTVTGAVNRTSDLFQQASITPAAQLQRLRIVGIIIP